MGLWVTISANSFDVFCKVDRVYQTDMPQTLYKHFTDISQTRHKHFTDITQTLHRYIKDTSPVRHIHFTEMLQTRHRHAKTRHRDATDTLASVTITVSNSVMDSDH